MTACFCMGHASRGYAATLTPCHGSWASRLRWCLPFAATGASHQAAPDLMRANNKHSCSGSTAHSNFILLWYFGRFCGICDICNPKCAQLRHNTRQLQVWVPCFGRQQDTGQTARHTDRTRQCFPRCCVQIVQGRILRSAAAATSKSRNPCQNGGIISAPCFARVLGDTRHISLPECEPFLELSACEARSNHVGETMRTSRADQDLMLGGQGENGQEGRSRDSFCILRPHCLHQNVRSSISCTTMLTSCSVRLS